VLWAGVEIQRLGLQDPLQTLVDRGGFWFTTTSLGKTVLDERQDQFIGTYAGPASPARTRAIMAACDCPVALGTLITDDYLEIVGSRYGQMVLATDAQTRVGFEQYPDVRLPDFLAALSAKLEGKAPRRYAVPEVRDEPSSEKGAAGADDRLTYDVFRRELGAFLTAQPQDELALILGESTSLYVFGNLFGLARDVFVAQAAWGSLGHETGCALGVALGSGRRPWVVAGDGGFRMVCQELSSLAQCRCNAVVFVLRNDVYAVEQAFVDLHAFEPDGEFAPFDVLPPWDYAALAKAFGAEGYRVESVGQLRRLLPDLEKLRERPALVEVVIPRKDLAPQLKRLAEAPPPTLRHGRR
jgi:indolepyruvate decarboxylase